MIMANLLELRDRAVLRYGDSLVLRVPRRMVAIGGYDRALALSAQAFVALVPVVVMVAALVPEHSAAGRELVSGLDPSGQAESALAGLFEEPPGVEPLTVLSSILLVLAVLGFTRTLQRAYLAGWEVPPHGARGLLHGLLAAVALVGEFALLALLGPVFAGVLDGTVTGIVVRAVAAVLLWWPILYLLLGGTVGWRTLLPGAALTGGGQVAVILVSGYYLPGAVNREAARYGMAGVAVALLSWLLVLGLLLVVSAVASAELVRPHSATRAEGTADDRPEPDA
ncbi:membrane protein [Pseudonocardia parietis]|uniref:Membrane protein n=2 Tax=Pseudonocardia parietis TaxID=570936 RepID=A0ABS4VXA6_9PSEU|nr:membrane protein [Pseudonocardia parietis]